MTVKDDTPTGNPPLVSATYVSDEPEIDLNEPVHTTATASMLSDAKPATVASSPVAYTSPPAPTTTTTTTTYTIPPPSTPSTPTNAASYGAALPPRSVGKHPARVTCPYCQKNMVTRTRDVIDGITIVAIIALIFLFWPLFWLPLCIPGCKATEHYCSNCNRRVARADACSG